MDSETVSTVHDILYVLGTDVVAIISHYYTNKKTIIESEMIIVKNLHAIV